MNEVRDPIGDARHQASRRRGMIIATSLVAAAFLVAWWRHHQAEVDHMQQHLDALDRIGQPHLVDQRSNPRDDPMEAARLVCRHIVDCSNAPADERADRVASCTSERNRSDLLAVNVRCTVVQCEQLTACLAR